MERTASTIREATSELGVSDKTIRRMLETGVLKEHSRDARGRILIDPRSIDAAAVQLGRKNIASPEAQQAMVAPGINALAEANQVNQQIVLSLLESMREKDRQMLEQAEQIGRLKAEQQLLPTRVATAQEEIEELQRLLSEQQAENERLRDELTKRVQTPDQVTIQANQGSAMSRIIRRLRGG